MSDVLADLGNLRVALWRHLPTVEGLDDNQRAFLTWRIQDLPERFAKFTVDEALAELLRLYERARAAPPLTCDVDTEIDEDGYFVGFLAE